MTERLLQAAYNRAPTTVRSIDQMDKDGRLCAGRQSAPPASMKRLSPFERQRFLPHAAPDRETACARRGTKHIVTDIAQCILQDRTCLCAERWAAHSVQSAATFAPQKQRSSETPSVIFVYPQPQKDKSGFQRVRNEDIITPTIISPGSHSGVR